ncbi:MAG: hypothetical protein D6748_13720 [Calditrichaeota bacterium]|nr:MAG: hypothetical protein D6748_13720 [Calditrichota bacterium]
MNYGQKIISLIQEEKARGVYADPKQKYYYLQHEEGDLQFQVRFKDIDKLGIVLDYLSIKKQAPILDVSLINQKLDEQAAAVEKRITFLLEGFKLIELDRQNKRAQLRSYPPHTKENSKYYYEIVLDEGTRVHFQRYEYSIPDKRYQKIDSQLTLETFERLLDELSDLLK